MTDSRLVEAMAQAMFDGVEADRWVDNRYAREFFVECAGFAHRAGCSPSLGEDRLVRLGDVIEKLRTGQDGKPTDNYWADFLIDAYGTGGDEHDETS